ncbi:MAG: hypothetical protein U5L08_14555 [Xanthomonadales bacterium]|nr:hypothetical protein [Xanthomonadales bacterium]
MTVAFDPAVEEPEVPDEASRHRGFWSRLLSQRSALVAVGFLGLLVLVAMFVPVVAPADPL